MAETLHNILYTRIAALCKYAPYGIYRADWDTFWKDTEGMTINTLASLGLYKSDGTGPIHLRLEDDIETYEIWINDAYTASTGTA